MSRRNDANKDVLSKIHEQIVKDQNNDSTQTGSFPVVRRKPKRVSLNAKATRARLYSSVLVTVLCALLGFSYAIQLNNTTSTYETMSEDELTKLISETSTQVQKLEQRKSELSNQLDSLKDTADKNEKAAEIARQNAESNGILSGRLPVSGEGVVIRISKGSKRDIEAWDTGTEGRGIACRSDGYRLRILENCMIWNWIFLKGFRRSPAKMAGGNPPWRHLSKRCCMAWK